jgi:multidrug efflux pump subunit AcrB
MTSSFRHRDDFLGIFARHPVAANLLMAAMIISGLWALGRLNTQFFPSFEMEVVTVRVVWQGATAEDVERSITVPLEQALRSVDGLDKMTSTSAQGVALVTLEFPEGTPMGEALDRVEERVASVRNLPTDAEQPEVTHVVRYEPIARLLVHGPTDMRELRSLARRFERELLDRGVSKIVLSGLPEEEVAIQIRQEHLEELGLSLGRVADRVAAISRDLPAGTVGRDDVGRQLRSLSQERSEQGFEQIPLVADRDGRLVRLGDVAAIERRARPDQVSLSYQGRPAVEIQAQRAETADSLVSAEVLQRWLEETRPRLPPGVEISVYDESWQLIKSRIDLLVKNGASGLVAVIAILFLFLHGRVTFWIAVGIPATFLATLAVVYLAGGSINMISLFALIMALGIIVDDAIVVGEDAFTHYQNGEKPLEAAEGGARRMLAPVMASSLTTIAAFIPLFSVSGVIGKILGDIPFVMVCVILASVIECFLVLPAHLRHTFLRMHHAEPGRLRASLDAGFAALRERGLRPLVTRAVDYRWTTIAVALACAILIFGLLRGGRIGFNFFPSVEQSVVTASATFVAGTPPDRVGRFIDAVEGSLYATDSALGGGLVRAAAVARGLGVVASAPAGQQGEQFASITVELVPSDERSVRNEEFLAEWERRIQRPPGLESLTLTSRRGGPPGRDLEVRFTGTDPEVLKAAALEVAEGLRAVRGVSGIEDDMPYGQQQLIYRLSPLGEALGLTIADVGRQLRGALDGHLAQIFNEGEEEVEVRVMLPDADRHRLAALEDVNLTLPGGGTVPLASALELAERRGFEALRHSEGRLAATVYADVNRALNNADQIRAQLSADTLPKLAQRHGIEWSFTGRAEDQAETMQDMKQGGLLALAMIYIILAWVFGSYGWPLVVIAIIPFGLVGAIFGHWAMGLELTILSMFGLFALSGIAVNDSIVLVTFYKALRKQGLAVREALIEASCQRLRAVLLTSLTTIAGLTPLLFETSVQAQFLIPMATSISFGLAFTTVLVLFLVPTLLSIHESVHARLPLRARELAEA